MDNYTRQTKQERSIPVQARVDIVSLADILLYIESCNLNVKTMSELISYAVEIARQVLENSDKLPVIHKSLTDAHQVINGRGLYQASMMRRGGRSKLAESLKMENLKAVGFDVEKNYSRSFNVLHNEHSVNVPEVGVVTGDVYSDEVSPEIIKQSKKAIETYNKMFVNKYDSSFKGITDKSAIMTTADILRKRQESEHVTKKGITDEDLMRQNEEDAEELRLMNEALSVPPAELVVEEKIVK